MKFSSLKFRGKNIKVGGYYVPQKKHLIIKQDRKISFNKIFKSFVIAKKYDFPEYFNVFKQYGYSLSVPVFVRYKQNKGYIPSEQSHLRLGSRFFMVEKGKVKNFWDADRGWLGISYIEGGNGSYAYVEQVLDGTPAKKYRLQKGDKIFAIDTFKIQPNKSIRENLGYRIWTKLPGQSVVLKVKRENEIIVKKIKLGRPPINIYDDTAEWIKIYRKHILIYRKSGLSVVDINTARRVWRFPTDFNFHMSDNAVYDADNDFIYSVVSTKMNLKYSDIRDVYNENPHFYFIKIELKNLQMILIRRVLLKGKVEIKGLYCNRNICFLTFIDHRYEKAKILPINSVNGKIGKVFTTIFSKYKYLDDTGVFSYNIHGIPENNIVYYGKKSACLISPAVHDMDDLIYHQSFKYYRYFYTLSLDCFDINIDKLILTRVKVKNFERGFYRSIGYNANNVFYMDNRRVYMYNFEKQKVYFLMLLTTNELYPNVYYKILPNGIAFIKKEKEGNYIMIRYVKNDRIYTKKLAIPKQERIIGLLSSDDWFSYLTTKNRYDKKICWVDKYISLHNRARCYLCGSILYPFFNNRKSGKDMKISIYLYSTSNYNKVFSREFILGKRPKQKFTLKPYLLLNKIYINSIIHTRKKDIIEIYPFTITSN